MAEQRTTDVAKLARAIADELASQIAEMVRVTPSYKCTGTGFVCKTEVGYSCGIGNPHECTGDFTCAGDSFSAHLRPRRPGRSTRR